MMLLGPDFFWFLHHLCCFYKPVTARAAQASAITPVFQPQEREGEHMPLPFNGMTRKRPKSFSSLHGIGQVQHPDHAWLWRRLAVVLFWVAVCTPHTVG